MHGAEKPVIPPDEDEALHARRLVAQKCLYGVDRNPMAVDLARLSLWLATLAREHEFTFLDHALKAGDSLVGLTRAEIAAAHWDSSRAGLPMFSGTIRDAIEKAREGREAIRNAGDDVRLEAQAARFSRVQDASEPARIVGDALIAAFFSGDKPKEREAERQKVESWVSVTPPKWDVLQEKAKGFQTEQGWRAFHWDIEFPEVFARENPGFDAVIGNPPFLGGSLLSNAAGTHYVAWLLDSFAHAHGKSDLAAFFIRQIYSLLRQDGCAGLVATKTIRQGYSRATALEFIKKASASIYRAVKRYRWPGEAAVVVTLIHFKKGQSARHILDGREVKDITSFLLPFGPDERPKTLFHNSNLVFSGLNPNGSGFVFEKPDYIMISSLCPSAVRYFRQYLSSDDLNGDPASSATRWILDVGLLTEDDLKQMPAIYDHLKATVWKERQKSSEKRLRDQWWKFSRPAGRLQARLDECKRVLAMGRLATHHTICFEPNEVAFSDALSVFTFEELQAFAVLQSRAHELWAKFLGSSFKDDPRYIPEDCFETFPFPHGYETDATLETAGQAYHDHRAQLMIVADEGMTKTYNRFHKSDERSAPIQTLRDLHDAMDRAVLRAYGWHDLADDLRPEFLTEDTEDDHTYQGRYFWNAEARDRVLSRLLALNAERHADEVAAGLVPATVARATTQDDEEAQGGLDL